MLFDDPGIAIQLTGFVDRFMKGVVDLLLALFAGRIQQKGVERLVTVEDINPDVAEMIEQLAARGYIRGCILADDTDIPISEVGSQNDNNSQQSGEKYVSAFKAVK
jgi:hypothetical protein